MWGGRRLESLQKPLPPDQLIGESWELYDFPPGVVEGSHDWLSASVADGALAGHTLHELVQAVPRRLLGTAQPVSTSAGPQFPLLVKFLDAHQDLSVQVHPTEAYSAAHPQAHVKNEAWYVLAHEPGARLLKGLGPGVTRRQFESALADGSVERLMHSVPARAGDVHYLPSGTLHALGGGMLVAEVQTPSDTTYRVFDFDRIDPATGQSRQLHVEQALAVIDFEAAPPATKGVGSHRDGDPIVRAPQFLLSKRSCPADARAALAEGAPSILIFIEGKGQIAGRGFDAAQFGKGDTLLVPADLAGPQVEAISDSLWLEVTFPAPDSTRPSTQAVK